MARKKKDGAQEPLTEQAGDKPRPSTEGPSVGVQALCGRIMQRFQTSGIPGALNLLEEGWDEADLEVAAERLREGFNRADLANMVLDRLKKIRQDIGAADVASQVIGTSKRHLPVKLTSSEVAEFSKKALETAAEADQEEKDAKQAFKDAKEGFDMLRSFSKDLRKKALSGEEMREVEIVNHWDSVAQKVRMVRADTGEEIGVRDATPQEMQLPLFGG